MAARVLIVDDEDDLREALSDVLVTHGFDVETGTTCADAVANADRADLLLLDLGLPDGDAVEICAELAVRVPLIVISARGDAADRISALELGADDYLAKPFNARELVARCRSVLRRSFPRGARSHRILAGELEVDLDTMQAHLGGDLVPLTTKERELLVALARRRGAVVRRDELAEEVWGSSVVGVTRTLDVHMSSLRRKLSDEARAPTYIETVHGIGFRLLQ